MDRQLRLKRRLHQRNIASVTIARLLLIMMVFIGLRSRNLMTLQQYVEELRLLRRRYGGDSNQGPKLG